MQGRGLKPESRRRLVIVVLSPLMQGRGLKLGIELEIDGAGESSPLMQGRGLKPKERRMKMVKC